MTRLAGYLMRLFAGEALALFALATFLLFLSQTLRLFDLVSVKGQDVLTLIGQVMLTMPTSMVAFAMVCVAIGLGRGMRTLQQSQELHIIHASRRVGALLGAIVGYALVSGVLIAILTNLLEPTTRKYYNAWAASVAADLVARTLMPNRFVDFAPGVTLVIGSRTRDGELGSFFADDRRDPESRRTYIARSARVAADEEGYFLQLEDGAIQFLTRDRQFSQITFARYDLAVGNLTAETAGEESDEGSRSTLDIAARAAASGAITPQAVAVVGARFGEGFRAIAFCLLVAAMTIFPHSRRTGFSIPIEITILGAAFIERGLSAVVPPVHPALPTTPLLVLAFTSALVLFMRLRRGSGRVRRILAA